MGNRGGEPSHAMNEFWAGRRVLVTGGSGFLGGYVVRKLNDRAANVSIIDRSRDDLRRLDNVRRVLAESNPQMVIHLAARVGGIGANRAHPAEFFYDNLMMSVPLL